MRRCWALAGFTALVPPVLAPQDRPAPTRTKVAEGVYLFRTAPYSDVGLDGNTVAVIGADGVLVFDSNGTPDAAQQVIAQIKQLTTAPVRYVVNSHWHWDHWYGTQAYRAAFPGVAVIAHEKTRALMAGPALEFNRPGIESQLPEHIRGMERVRDAKRTAGAAPAELATLERHLAADRFFLDQKRNTQHVLPELTFRDSLTLWLGDRAVRVLHYERGVTPGDAFLYLPADQLLLTGDLLGNPMAFALGAYPAEWLRTLERMAALPLRAIVPGHGDALPDKQLLEAHIAALRELIRLGRDAKRRGRTVEQARAEAGTAIREARQRITRDDPALNQQFDLYLVDWLLHRVYEEATGALTDSIGPIPRHP